MAARFDPADPAVGWQAQRLGDIGPVAAAVARQLDIAVVGPDPDQSRGAGAFADRIDCRVHFRGRIVDRDPARILLLLLQRVVGREVGRNAVPAVAVIAAAEQKLRADVDRPTFVRRQRDRRVPIVAQFLLESRLRLDVALFERLAIDPADIAALRFGISVIGVRRIAERPEAVTTIEIFPAAVGDPPRIFLVANPTRIILQATIDLIRISVVGADMVELADRKIHAVTPLGAAVFADPQPAVIAANHVFGVGRVDPQRVPVGMTAAAAVRKALSTILRRDHRIAHLEDALVVLRIDDHPSEIKRPPHHPLAAVAFLETFAAVFGNIERRANILDKGIDLLGIVRRERDFDPTPWLLGKAGGIAGIEVAPTASTVERFDHPTARGRFWSIPARAESPTFATEIPRPGEQAIVVARVHRDGRAAGREIGALENQTPGPSAVAGLVQPAIGAVRPQPARRADIDRIAILGIDQDARDALAVGQTDEAPILAAVDRFINAVANRHRIARPALTGADPNDLGIGRIDYDVADRLDRLAVEHRAEGHAPVFALPHPARRGADEQGRLAIGLAVRSDCGDPPRHLRRADVADAKARDRAGVEHACDRGGGDQRSGNGEGSDAQQEAAHQLVPFFGAASGGVGLAPSAGCANRIAGASTFAVAVSITIRWR